uniref:Nucleolus and neural progenitor protein-like N-terminal domain-containing protein n=1 Tax=Culex tarsalis TaxID=7177 RepID=A0A1Q3EXV7_CULTA
MELWNQKDLVPPALATYRCKSKSCKAEIRALVSTLSEAIQYYEQLSSSFDLAAAYLSRFTTRWNNRFYNMHGFRLLKRLNQAVVRFRSVDIVRILTNVFSTLPDGNYLEPVVELPTRGNLDYLLVRLQGVAKLFCRIVVLAKEAARYYVRFMSSGYFFNLSTMFLCLQAEIWLKARQICQRTVEFYNKLITLRPFLEPGASSWPSKDGISLPEQLCTWLGDDWTNEIIAKDDSAKELNLKSSTNLFVLLTGEPTDLSTTQKVDKQIASKLSAEDQVVSSIPKGLLMQRISAATDLGEVVSRKASSPKATPAKESPRSDDGLVAIRSKFDVRKFLDEEKRKRREDPKQALSRDVMAGQFGVFVAGISRDMNRLPTKEFVREFKQGWKKMVEVRKDKSKQQK